MQETYRLRPMRGSLHLPHPRRARTGHVHSAIDQNKRPPIVKGGSPPKKRHMRSLPPFALHLQYAPTSGEPDWKRNCGIIPPLPSKENLPKTAFPRYMPKVGPSDKSALNPGIFILSNLLREHIVSAYCAGMRRSTCHQPNPTRITIRNRRQSLPSPWLLPRMDTHHTQFQYSGEMSY